MTGVIDVDMHFNETADTWANVDVPRAERLCMATDRQGRSWLRCGDRNLIRLRVTVPGDVDLARDLVREDPRAFEAMLARRRDGEDPPRPHPAESDAGERVRVLDAMNVDAALLFPSFGLFWPSVVPDEQLGDCHHRAWNDWIAEAARAAPGRLLPVAQFTLSDVARTTAEIRRCGALGHRGLFLRAVPYRGLPWSDPANEPVWSALEDADLALLLHAAPIGSTSIDPAWDKGIAPTHAGQPIPTFLTRAAPAEAVLANLIFEGVLERHPALRIGAIEFGATWVPSFLQRMDFTFDFLAPRNRYLRERLRLRPSEYFRRQVKVSTFWSEPIPWLFESAGPELFMYASDFPHPEGNEQALTLARAALTGISPDAQAAFFSGNARHLLGLGSPEEVRYGA